MGDVGISSKLASEAAAGTLNLDRATVAPAIPAALSDDVGALRRAVTALKQVVDLREGRSASVLDKALTLRDLVDEGALELSVGGKTITGRQRSVLVPAPTVPDGGSLPVLPVPPVPTGLRAMAAISEVVLFWSFMPYANHAYCEVWRASAAPGDPPAALGTAVLAGTTTGTVYLDSAVAHNVVYYYWVRAVNTEGVRGPYNAVEGVPAELGENVADLLDILTGKITESQLYRDLGHKVDLLRWIEDELSANAENTLSTLLSMRAQTDSSLAVIAEEAATRAAADEAEAVLRTTLAAVVHSPSALPTDPNYNPTYAALQTEANVRAALDGAVQALWTLRMEVSSGGRTVVGGIGLAGTATAAQGPRIDFGVRADQFWVAAPAGSGVADRQPFIVRTTVTTENGVDIPAGVYMDAAYITNLAAMWARFGTLVADSIAAADISANRITSGTLSADRIAANSLSGGKITAGTVSADRLAARTITAESGVIADLAVDTLQLANQAVTIPVSVYSSAYIEVPVGTGFVAQTCSIDSTGAPILVIGSVTAYVPISTSGVSTGYLQLVRDGSTVVGSQTYDALPTDAVSGNYGVPLTVLCVDTPGAGHHTYSLVLTMYNATTTSGHTGNRTLALLETKK